MKHVSIGARAPLAVLFALCLARPAEAVVTSHWTVDTYEEWNEGESADALITSLGEVKPGWTTERVALETEGIWSALRARDGSILLGTDDGGAIYRIRGDEVTRLAAIEGAVAVVSLAEGADGTIYAGTMPAGQVWKIDPAGAAAAGVGAARKLADLDGAETVWALALDKAGSTLYAGTGPNGALFAVDLGTGKARVAFETEDKRILAVLATADGGIWLGTSDKALVFRYDPARGSARAMADFSGNEITAMADAGNSVVVAANEFEEPSTSGVKTKAAIAKAKKKPRAGQAPDMPKTGSEPGADKRDPEDSKPGREGARKGKGALFRVYGDGRLAQLHALTATYFSDVVVTETGAVFAGAGDKGRVYLVDTDDSVSTAFDVDERIIARMIYEPGEGLSFATTDTAAWYRTKGKARTATYLSEVFDTGAPSRFGKLVWHGHGLRVETRTGNTAKPGKGWSTFQGPRRAVRGGGGSEAGHITSPTGRYIQLRVSFEGNGKGDAVLRKARVYYLPQNEPSRITDVTIHNEAADGKGRTLKSGAAAARSPVLELKWKADNPDDDSTEYTLEVRREGEALWRALRDEPITATKLSWNTETFPDGYYRLRVTASDRRANSADRAREHARISRLFLVDNERPRIEGLQVDYPQAGARAVDAMSAIAEMAFSIDDGPWQVGATVDGIFDDSSEFLRIQMPADLRPGLHTLALRVADEAGNIGSASVSFRVK